MSSGEQHRHGNAAWRVQPERAATPTHLMARLMVCHAAFPGSEGEASEGETAPSVTYAESCSGTTIRANGVSTKVVASQCRSPS